MFWGGGVNIHEALIYIKNIKNKKLHGGAVSQMWGGGVKNITALL